MRVILAGQRSFGAAVFDMLVEQGHDIASVWAPLGESEVCTDPLSRKAWPVHLALTNQRTPEYVRSLEADLFVAAHSHDFIGHDSRAATRLGGIGYHPSLLPRHRGRDAVRWTVHMGDPIAGGSVYWLTDNVDAGSLAAQTWCHVVPGWTASDLWRRELFPMGVALLAAVLRHLDQGLIYAVEQDERVATWEPSWERPPLHRPELRQIGSPNGFEVIGTKEEAMRRARESERQA